MNFKGAWVVLTILLAGASGPAKGVQNWRLTLPDTVVVTDGLVTLADLAGGPVPAAAGRVVIRAGVEPNSLVAVSRRDILRRLVVAGLAGGVSLGGAEECHLIYPGKELTPKDLEAEVRGVVQSLMPRARPGAPDSWFEIDLPPFDVAAAAEWNAELDRTEFLTPGRNLVRIRLVDGDRTESMTVTITLHQFGEVGLAVRDISRDSPLDEGMFTWQWRDLADLKNGLAVGRESIQGASCTRDVKTGQLLRQADLRETPLVKAGDPVDLRVVRGQVAVVVKAHARQNGCLGQTIPVRNELSGRLVNARVAGPGLVEWRR